MTEAQKTKKIGMAGLHREREAARLSKTALAEKIGTTRQNVTAWEARKTWPVGYWLPVIAAALGCGVDDLLRPDPEEANETK